MSTNNALPPVRPGEPAPDFTLAAVDGSDPISLADYRGRIPVFLSLLVGLWCPFCRRTIAQLGATESRLREVGAETLGVVATPPENARLYFKFRPSRLRIGADPELKTHRAYRVPKPEPTPELMKGLEATRINPNGELPEPLPVLEAAAAIGKLDGYVENETDQADMQRQWPQLKAQFLIDREGIVRWANIEGSQGLSSIGQLPSIDEIVSATKALSRH